MVGLVLDFLMRECSLGSWKSREIAFVASRPFLKSSTPFSNAARQSQQPRAPSGSCRMAPDHDDGGTSLTR